jgi:hypothetical protein
MMDKIKMVQDLPKVREGSMQGMGEGSGPTQGKGKEACRDWRNHLKRMMD